MKPLDPIVVISLAIKPPGDHVGIIYRASPRALRMLHLAGHYDLRDDPANPNYFWIEMDLDPDVALLAPALCKLVARKYRGPGLAYSVHHRGDRFDLTTGALLTPRGRGFTCATFVMALFDSLGSPLVKSEEWTLREGDRDRLEEILAGLAGAHPEHVEAERVDLPCVRFRPEEVAAAGTSTNLPVGFEYAQRVGGRIADRLRTASTR